MPAVHEPLQEPQAARVFELAAELFGVLSTPLRLRLLSALCNEEKTVSQRLGELGTPQPTLAHPSRGPSRAGRPARRKEGAQVYYRVQSEKAAALCRSVCTQVAIELDDRAQLPPQQRLVGRVA